MRRPFCVEQRVSRRGNHRAVKVGRSRAKNGRTPIDVGVRRGGLREEGSVWIVRRFSTAIVTDLSEFWGASTRLFHIDTARLDASRLDTQPGSALRGAEIRAAR